MYPDRPPDYEGEIIKWVICVPLNAFTNKLPLQDNMVHNDSVFYYISYKLGNKLFWRQLSRGEIKN